MRVLVATDQWFPDRMGGVARVATDTARGWAARGHEVVVVAPRHEAAAETTIEDGVEVLRVLPRGVVPQTVADPLATRRWAKGLRGRRFDVAVAHCATTAWGLERASLGCPLVYVFHADAAREARYLRATLRPGRDWLATVAFEPLLRRLASRSLRAADAVVVLSEFSRRVLSETWPDSGRRAVLVPGAVDTTAFAPLDRDDARRQLGAPANSRIVFTARRLEPRMGLENLLHATRLLSDVPDLHVVVAGSGGRLDLQELRAQLGLESRVDLVGRVSDDDLRRWYAAADLFVLPTLAYEGFGLVTAEALACGTPVVGTPVGATPEILEPLDSRLLARSSAPGDLADAIRTGLQLATPELRARCREYALARLSWTAALPEWDAVLDDVVRGRRAARTVDGDAGLQPVEDG